MTEAMKHRLVGAAVLIALGVIAWPVIFDSSPVREISQRSQIPPEPQSERFTVAEPERPQLPPEPDWAAQRDAAATGPGPADPAVQPAPEPAPTAAAKPPAAPAVTPKPVRSAEPSVRPTARDLPKVKAVTTDPSGLPQQWAVQLGVFSQLANAREIQQRANAAGFHAILQSSGTAGAQQHRVYVNPKLERADADAIAAEVQRKLGVKGYVTRYYP
ncbi:MAG TPA: SPOR domain-containing protein [Pseudomonadales bacterium]|nr:SPOR domain-containing protein [Pseudomonadales bacterium]HND13568.1 SPOR domain-containing protein [Pseudomonadales bacterium]